MNLDKLKDYVVLQYSGNMCPNCKTEDLDECEVIESFESLNLANAYAIDKLRDSQIALWLLSASKQETEYYKKINWNDHQETKEFNGIIENFYENTPDTATFHVYSLEDVYSLEEED